MRLLAILAFSCLPGLVLSREVRKCANITPPTALDALHIIHAKVDRLTANAKTTQASYVIDTYIHVISDNAASDALVTDVQLSNQVRVILPRETELPFRFPRGSVVSYQSEKRLRIAMEIWVSPSRQLSIAYHICKWNIWNHEMHFFHIPCHIVLHFIFLIL